MTLRDYAIRYGFIVLLFGLIAYFAIAADGFVSPQSAVFIFQSVAITGVLALGVTATLVVGGFDLSIGSVATIGHDGGRLCHGGAGAERRRRGRRLPAHRRHGRPDQWLADRLYARARSPGDARHDVPARRPAAHPDRRPLDRHRHDHARRLGRQRQVQPTPSWRSAATASTSSSRTSFRCRWSCCSCSPC